MSDAADFALEEASKPEQDMFDTVPRASRSDVMDRARKRFDEIQEEKNAGKANEQEAVLQDADGSVRAEEDVTGRDARADQVAPDARGSQSAERSEESVTEQAPEQGKPKFSRNHEGSPSAEDVARTLEADKDIGDSFTQLRDNGEVEVVQSVDDLPEEIRSQIEGVKQSKQNKATRNVVHDSAATESNVVGKVGTVRLKKEKDGFYNGDIVVPEGRKSGTGGARHLSLNAIKDALDRTPLFRTVSVVKN